MNATASPTYIRSSAEFRRQIEFGETTESLVLEFKRDYGKRRTEKRKVVRNTQKELCRDIAQFANTWGGCLLIGVDEREDPGRNLRIADKIMGVDDPDSLRQWITQAAKNYLVPSTTSPSVPVGPQWETTVGPNPGWGWTQVQATSRACIRRHC